MKMQIPWASIFYLNFYAFFCLCVCVTYGDERALWESWSFEFYFKNIFIFMYLYECLHICVCNCLHVWCPLRPEEGVDRITWNWNCRSSWDSVWVLETDPRSSARAVSANYCQIPLLLLPLYFKLNCSVLLRAILSPLKSKVWSEDYFNEVYFFFTYWNSSI